MIRSTLYFVLFLIALAVMFVVGVVLSVLAPLLRLIA